MIPLNVHNFHNAHALLRNGSCANANSRDTDQAPHSAASDLGPMSHKNDAMKFIWVYNFVSG